MQMGMIGLGRMGGNMVRRLLRDGHSCAVYDRDAANIQRLVDEGAQGASTLELLVQALAAPRAIWLMVPAGDPTESTVNALGALLSPGDTIIDGGNSNFKDDVRRAKALRARGIHYIDAGTSGGVWGLERGYCMMIGGDVDAVTRLEPIFRSLAPGRGTIGRTPGRGDNEGTAEEGFLHCGPNGAGHYVKMVHNGIEYGMMQAFAEGFELFKTANLPSLPEGERYDLPIGEIAELWRRGSVVSSWLLDLSAQALHADPALDAYSGFVQDSGEGRWTVQAAIDQAVSAEVITSALFTRFRSRQTHTFAEKVLSAMRQQFGGHVEPPKAG